MKEKVKAVLFKNLTPQEISWLQIRFRPRRLAANTIIFKEGTVGDEIYVIESGQVEVFLTRGEVVLSLSELQEPSFFGELSFLTDKPHFVTVKAKTDCHLSVLKKEGFMEVVEENPKVAAKFLMALAESLCNQITTTNINLEKYFLVNQAIVDNESFRKLYILTHKAPSSSG
jgi:CRP-like cAMP-binding protein